MTCAQCQYFVEEDSFCIHLKENVDTGSVCARFTYVHNRLLDKTATKYQSGLDELIPWVNKLPPGRFRRKLRLVIRRGCRVIGQHNQGKEVNGFMAQAVSAEIYLALELKHMKEEAHDTDS